MPITQPESGLTQTDYDKITQNAGKPAWSVIAHRYNLDFLDTAPGVSLPVDEVEDKEHNARK